MLPAFIVTLGGTRAVEMYHTVYKVKKISVFILILVICLTFLIITRSGRESQRVTSVEENEVLIKNTPLKINKVEKEDNKFIEFKDNVLNERNLQTRTINENTATYVRNHTKMDWNETEKITLYDVPARNMKPDTWQVIGNATNRRKVYSAFYDDRPEMKKRYSRHGEEPIAGVVRIISILQFRISENHLTCHLSYNNSDYTIESPVRVHAIRENRGFLFSASFIVCGVYANIVNSATGAIVLPDSVAISDDSLKIDHLQFLPVRYPLKANQSEESHTLAVCVPPLFKKYDEYLTLIEYIEIYKLLGVNHFFLYNSSISDKVSQVLEYYQGKGQVTVEQWNFTGYEFEKEVRYNGIFAALNDCLYRASFMHGYKYVVNTDMDEILFPRQHEDLIELLSTIEPQKAGIIFRNTFFFMQEKNESTVGNNFLLTQSKVVRTKEILPSHQRSKYIYKGKGVVELGNHFIWEYYPGYREHVLPETVGLSHHYRITCLGNRCTSYDAIQDTTARRYEDQLAANVEKACSEIFKSDVV